jgi:hypothetical protein
VASFTFAFEGQGYIHIAIRLKPRTSTFSLTILPSRVCTVNKFSLTSFVKRVVKHFSLVKAAFCWTKS